MLLARVEQLGVSRGPCMLSCAALGAGVMYMLDPIPVVAPGAALRCVIRADHTGIRP